MVQHGDNTWATCNQWQPVDEPKKAMSDTGGWVGRGKCAAHSVYSTCMSELVHPMPGGPLLLVAFQAGMTIKEAPGLHLTVSIRLMPQNQAAPPERPSPAAHHSPLTVNS